MLLKRAQPKALYRRRGPAAGRGPPAADVWFAAAGLSRLNTNCLRGERRAPQREGEQRRGGREGCVRAAAESGRGGRDGRARTCARAHPTSAIIPEAMELAPGPPLSQSVSGSRDGSLSLSV